MNNKEPFVRMIKRPNISLGKKILIYLVAIILALIVCAVVTVGLTAQNPIQVYSGMVGGAVGTTRRAWVTIRETMFLLLIAVGLTPAFKMKFWNIGAEGQILIGGMTTAALMIYCGNSVPSPVLLIMVFVLSSIAGMVWGIIPAYFKAKHGTNETLFTLMMNYVAMQIVNIAIIKWENPKGSNNVGIINQQTKGGWFPSIAGNQYLLSVIIVLLITFIMYRYLRYTKQGYEISVVGSSQRTARYIGINVPKVILRTMAVSSGICGIAGALIVGGSSHTISTSTAGGRGFTAIIVAWMAKFNPFFMILISLLIVFMQQGAIQVASQFNLNENASEIITGIILFFLIGCEFFVNYKLELRKKEVA